MITGELKSKIDSLWEIFWIFAKIGAFTIGGGIPMIAAIKSELTKRKWLNDEDFVDIITLAQTAPGLFAANIAILTGHRLRGTKGTKQIDMSVDGTVTGEYTAQEAIGGSNVVLTIYCTVLLLILLFLRERNKASLSLAKTPSQGLCGK